MHGIDAHRNVFEEIFLSLWQLPGFPTENKTGFSMGPTRLPRKSGDREGIVNRKDRKAI